MEIRKIKHKIPLVSLGGAVLILAIGLLMLFLPPVIIETAFIFLLMGVLFIYGGIRVALAFIDKNYIKGILSVSICWTLALLLYTCDEYFDAVISLPSILVGAVAILLGLMRLLICINSIINQFPGRVRNGISAVLCLGFGLFLVIRPIDNMGLLTMVAGFYMIFYSVTMLGDAFASIFRSDLDENRTKRRIHFALPNIITALGPSMMINKINKKLDKGQIKSGMVVEEKENTEFDTVNAEILVHLTTQGPNKFGHIDISIGEEVYSYGTYDPSSVKFAGFVSGGSYIEVPKISYLKYCLDYQKKYVIGYGVHFSGKQLEVLKNRIADFKNNCELLESEYERAVRENRDGSEYKDSASNIVRDVGGKVYLVTEGIYKRYFGININCVQFADWLLKDTGIDAMSFSGIRTPGAYYSMLETMFRRKNTRIIRKTWYIKSSDIKYVEKLGAVEEKAE